MILISDKSVPNRINIPRNTGEVYENYVLFLSKGNNVYQLELTDVTERDDFRTATVDFSGLSNGEYEYKLNSGEIGLLRIGEINRTNTTYKANEEYKYYRG